MTLSKQEVFDTVATHLFAQGKRAFNKDAGSCAYRLGTLKCAVGILIPDELYTPSMEITATGDLGAIVTDLLIQHPILKNYLPYPDLLVNLQNVHDNVSSWTSTEFMRGALEVVASFNKLSPKILSTLKFSDR